MYSLTLFVNHSLLLRFRAIKEMMANGLSDPYCRFITPKELSLMKKYDITGIGLNLGTGEEYERKTGRPLAVGPGVTKEEEGEATHLQHIQASHHHTLFVCFLFVSSSFACIS
jgi:hypothetical protein